MCGVAGAALSQLDATVCGKCKQRGHVDAGCVLGQMRMACSSRSPAAIKLMSYRELQRYAATVDVTPRTGPHTDLLMRCLAASPRPTPTPPSVAAPAPQAPAPPKQAGADRRQQTVRLPETAVPGEVIDVLLGGGTYTITVPPGARGGSDIIVEFVDLDC